MTAVPRPGIPPGIREPVHPLIAAGVVVFAAGILMWAWLGVWQWALTGAVLLLLLGVLVNVRPRKG